MTYNTREPSPNHTTQTTRNTQEQNKIHLVLCKRTLSPARHVLKDTSQANRRVAPIQQKGVCDIRAFLAIQVGKCKCVRLALTRNSQIRGLNQEPKSTPESQKNTGLMCFFFRQPPPSGAKNWPSIYKNSPRSVLHATFVLVGGVASLANQRNSGLNGNGHLWAKNERRMNANTRAAHH